jgi:hypothetical protein
LENSTGCLPVGLSGVFEELQIEINCKWDFRSGACCFP